MLDGQGVLLDGRADLQVQMNLTICSTGEEFCSTGIKFGKWVRRADLEDLLDGRADLLAQLLAQMGEKKKFFQKASRRQVGFQTQQKIRLHDMGRNYCYLINQCYMRYISEINHPDSYEIYF